MNLEYYIEQDKERIVILLESVDILAKRMEKNREWKRLVQEWTLTLAKSGKSRTQQNLRFASKQRLKSTEGSS